MSDKKKITPEAAGEILTGDGGCMDEASLAFARYIQLYETKRRQQYQWTITTSATVKNGKAVNDAKIEPGKPWKPGMQRIIRRKGLTAVRGTVH